MGEDAFAACTSECVFWPNRAVNPCTDLTSLRLLQTTELQVCSYLQSKVGRFPRVPPKHETLSPSVIDPHPATCSFYNCVDHCAPGESLPTSSSVFSCINFATEGSEPRCGVSAQTSSGNCWELEGNFGPLSALSCPYLPQQNLWSPRKNPSSFQGPSHGPPLSPWGWSDPRFTPQKGACTPSKMGPPPPAPGSRGC